MKNEGEMDLKSLWNARKIPVADLSSVRKQVRRFRWHRLMEVSAIIILTISVMALGVVVWVCWTPQLVVTKIGIVLVTIAFVLSVLSHGRSLYLYYGLNEHCTGINYVNRLLAIKRQEIRLQRIVLSLYFLFLSLGFGLYGYEYTFYRSTVIGVVSYTLLSAWIALNWFVLRPRMLKKRNRRFSDCISHIEKIRHSFSE